MSEKPPSGGTDPAPNAPVATAPKAEDVVFLGPPTADGAGVHVLRAREQRIEAGELRALAEGRPIVGEVIALKPRSDNARVCDVETLATSPVSPASRKGPAQVASSTYRERWDAIFGSDGSSDDDDAQKRKKLN